MHAVNVHVYRSLGAALYDEKTFRMNTELEASWNVCRSCKLSHIYYNIWSILVHQVQIGVQHNFSPPFKPCNHCVILFQTSQKLQLWFTFKCFCASLRYLVNVPYRCSRTLGSSPGTDVEGLVRGVASALARISGTASAHSVSSGHNWSPLAVWNTPCYWWKRSEEIKQTVLQQQHFRILTIILL